MPHNFRVRGWMDFSGNRHDGPATRLRQTRGVYVHITDPDNPQTGDRWFWFYTTTQFRSWEEWYVYIGTMLAMYGIDLGE